MNIFTFSFRYKNFTNLRLFVHNIYYISRKTRNLYNLMAI